MSYFDSDTLKIGDIVEHHTQREGYPEQQGAGLLTRLNKIGTRPEFNLWEVKFFSGDTFEILEEYLKKIQGTVDTSERV